MYSYKCVFNFCKITRRDGQHHSVSYDQDGIHAFVCGFWINDDLKFTKGTDAKYWIPLSQILYIEKLEKGV